MIISCQDKQDGLQYLYSVLYRYRSISIYYLLHYRCNLDSNRSHKFLHYKYKEESQYLLLKN